MYKKLTLSMALALFAVGALMAQVPHDPNDQLYRDMDRWFTQGYITTSLPQIRPYPAQFILVLLDEVISQGDAEAQKKALRYRSALSGKDRPFHVGLTGTLVGENDDATVYGAPTVDGVLALESWLTASYDLGVYGSLRKPGEELLVPGTYSPYSDFIEDWASVGPFLILQNWTSSLALGTASVYMQAGLNRTSFGPFYDTSTVIGSQAGRAGHFSVEYRKDTWNFGVLFMALTATDDFGKGQFSDKYLMLHSFDFRPLPNVEWGFFESVVWGARLEPLYFIPFNQLFASQSMTGFSDNSFFGFHVRWRPLSGLLVRSQVYVDDLNFNDLVSFKFDTKYKLAAQGGLDYVSQKDWFPNLRLEYTAVMPYMYTHENSINRYIANTPNYTNYTHRGRSLGSDLEPNSDRVRLVLSKPLLPELTVALTSYFTRHGNASEGIAGMTSAYHDGTIFDDGRLDDGTATFHYETRFLTQSVIDYRLAGGLGLSWSLPTDWGNLALQADCVAEHGWNRNLEKGNNGWSLYWSVTGSWRW